MDKVLDYEQAVLTQERFLEKHRLIRLKLGWELSALRLDGAGLSSEDPVERAESRAAAAAFRQCIADISRVVGPSLP